MSDCYEERITMPTIGENTRVSAMPHVFVYQIPRRSIGRE